MKEKVFLELRRNMGDFVSGECLSETLGVSRTAVWKHIGELRKDGYDIEASSRKGYRLVSEPDLLCPSLLQYGLDTRMMGNRIHCFDTVDSTNNIAKQLASEGCTEGTVVIADRQTGGKGRLGRSWFSQAGKGIWMSIVLRPDINPYDVQIITLAASVAVCRALTRTAGIQAGIKWPNDVMLGGKKVCGILTEMNSEMERVNFLVIGIGVNVGQTPGDFPLELRETAISLNMFAKEKGDVKTAFKRNDIIKSILFEMEQVYFKLKDGRTEEILKAWKEFSVTLGKEVVILSRNGSYQGSAEDITPDGRLVVRLCDGTVREVLSGEVSVRGLKDQGGVW